MMARPAMLGALESPNEPLGDPYEGTAPEIGPYGGSEPPAEHEL